VSLKIWKHGTHLDWCHLCGKRKTASADVWYAFNAEREIYEPSRYVRICVDCAERIVKVAGGPEKTKIYEEERLLLECQEAITRAIERSGLTFAQVAAKLDENDSFVAEALSSGKNLTLASLASLAWATGQQIEFRLATPSEKGE
jgi:ribosome-binding protein aMBF1 (putative translation factor)